MPLRPRPEIENLVPSPHGGLNHAELKALGLDADEVLDFSVCSNPYIPPPELGNILDDATVSRLPDSQAAEFRECLAGRLGVSPDNVLAGNGSTELIYLIAQAYFTKGDSVLILEPTFGEYPVACRIAGAAVLEQRAAEDKGFAHDVEGTVALVQKHRVKGIFLCNPNNPTGRYLSLQEIETVLAACPDSLLIMDEAYISFVDNSWSSLSLISRDNLVILRSMTKEYSLAGLRLGYAVAHPEIIAILRRVAQPWSVNAVAQQAGILALNDKAAFERARREIRKAARFLADGLSQLGLTPLPSQTHFFLVKVGDAAKFRTSLLRQGMLVRDCASFGLPEYVRIAARTITECRKLIAAIQRMR